MPDTKTAFAYMTASEAFGTGTSRQLEAIVELSLEAGYDIVGDFADSNVTSTPLHARLGLLAMLRACVANRVRAVLMERPERLGRDLISQVLASRLFERYGVTIRFATGPIDLAREPARLADIVVQRTLAELDLTRTLDLYAAREAARRRGGGEGGRKRFGTKSGEVETLRRMRQLRRKPRGGCRLTYREIARKLEEEGHRSRSGRPWSPGTVQRILARGLRRETVSAPSAPDLPRT